MSTDAYPAAIHALLAEAERAKAAAKFEDMGYDDCETCRQARLRVAFRPRAGARPVRNARPRGRGDAR